MAQAENHNSTWVKAIRAAAQHGRLSHAVILTGEGDKVQAARYIAAAHLCRADSGRPCLQCNACRKVLDRIHPDVTEVQDSERKELPVETIRALRQDAYIRPNEGERKVYLFTDCAQLNERDQNVLLKIVEEGPPYAAFVFCADAVHALLPTIRSRCVELRMDAPPLDAEEGEAAAELCRVIARREPLALTAHLTALENRRLKREQLLPMVEGAWQISADALLSRCGKPGACGEAADMLRRAFDRRQLQALTDLFRRYCGECQYNVGVGHVLGALGAELAQTLAL